MSGKGKASGGEQKAVKKTKKKVQIGKYVKVRKLGQGTYGKVYLTTHADTGQFFVLKEVDLSMLKKHQKEQAIKEIRFLNSFKHPAIVGYEEYFQVKYKGHIILYIVMEFADGGDMGGLIKQAKASESFLEEDQVIDWFVQLCLALKHIHDRKIIHRDIKSENVFLLRNRRVKLGDFGVARSLENTVDQAKTQVGTPYYLSPEICQNHPYDSKTDVWAMGAVMYELLMLRHPFEAKNLHSLVLKIVGEEQPPISRRYSKELRQAVMSCLLKDPTKRPAVRDLLELPILQERISKFLDEDMQQDEFSHTILHGDGFSLAGLIKGQGPSANEQPEIKELKITKTSTAPVRARPVKETHSSARRSQPKQQQQQQQQAPSQQQPDTSSSSSSSSSARSGGGLPPVRTNRPVSSYKGPPRPRKGESNCSRCKQTLGRSYFRCEYCKNFVLCSVCLSRSHHDPSHTFAHVIAQNQPQIDRGKAYSSHANMQQHARNNMQQQARENNRGLDRQDKTISRFDKLRRKGQQQSQQQQQQRETPKQRSERRKIEAAEARARELEMARKRNYSERTQLANQRKQQQFTSFNDQQGNSARSSGRSSSHRSSSVSNSYEQQYLKQKELPVRGHHRAQSEQQHQHHQQRGRQQAPRQQQQPSGRNRNLPSLHTQAVANVGRSKYQNVLRNSDSF